MNLTQIIVYKHQDQQSFVSFLIQKHKRAHTCVAVLTPDSLIVKYFMTLCITDLKKIKYIKKIRFKLKKCD